MPAAGRPTTSVVEIEFTAGVWTDVSQWIDLDSGAIARQAGRSSTVDTVSPGSLTFTLDAPDGRFIPDNPLSPHFPNVVEGKRVRWTVTKGATSSQRFIGAISVLEPQIEANNVGTVTVTALDALASTVAFEGLPVDAVQGAGPSAYWRLNESAEPFVNSAGGPGLYSRKGVAGSISNAAGVGPDVDGTQPALFGPGGSGARSHLRTFTAIGGLTTFECWFQFGTSTGEQWIAFIPRSGDPNLTTSTEIWLTSGGAIRARGSLTDLTAAGNYADGVLHHLVVTTGGGAQGIYVDGVLQVSSANTIGGRSTNGPILIGGDGVGRATPNGSISHVAVYKRNLSAAEVTDHYRAGQGYAGQTLRTAAIQIGAWAGITVTADAAFGPQLCAPLDLAGKSLNDALQYVAAGGGSVAFDDGAGVVIPATVRGATVQATVDVEADLNGPADVARDTQGRVAIATATSKAGSGSWSDATVRAAIGPVSATVDVPNAAQAELDALASDRLAARANPRRRIAKAVLDLITADNDLYAAVLTNAATGMRVRLSNLPTTQFGVTYEDAYLQGFTETLTLDGYTFEMDFEPAGTVTQFDNDEARFASDGDMTVNAAITSSGTSLQVATAGANTLPTTAGLYPLRLYVNGEIVTATAAPAGAASPQTLTATRGVAPSVARAHVAGEPIEVGSATFTL